MDWLLLIVGGYLAGSMPFGYWVVRLFKHVDIRTVGSGNIGGTNVWRVYGRWLGFPVVLLDTAKGFVPALLAVIFVGHGTAVLAGAAVAVVGLHRKNIERLLHGQENRFELRRRRRAADVSARAS